MMGKTNYLLGRKHFKISWFTIIKYVFLVLFAVIFLFPVVYLLSSSVMSDEQIRNPTSIFPYQFKLNFETYYPTFEEGQNKSADSLVSALSTIEDIFVNGISLYDRLINFNGNGIKAYYNSDNTFSINFAMNGEEEVTDIIIRKGCKFPIYNMTDMGLAAYGVISKTAPETIHYVKNAEGKFVKEESYKWSVIFDDGENKTVVLVEDGEVINPDDIPTAKKDGYTFDKWVTGIDGSITFNASAKVKGSVYYVAEYTKASGESSSEKESGTVEKKGCFGSIGSDMMLGAMLLLATSAVIILKKKNYNA